MRALRKVTAGPGLELVDVAEPTCGDKDVKIRVLRAGLCGTDLHLEQWDEWAAATVQVPSGTRSTRATENDSNHQLVARDCSEFGSVTR